jgi:hypothetical protein
MRDMKIRKDKTFLEMKSTKKLGKISSGTQKRKKLTEAFLGCVECSTNGDLLGERKIYVPTSGSGEGDVNSD